MQPTRPATPRPGYSPTGAQNPKVQRRPAPKPLSQRIRWSKIVLCSCALYFTINLIGNFFSIYDLKQQQAGVEAEIAALKAEQETLLAQIDYLATEPAIEKMAREKLGLVKPGEIMVIRANDAAAAE